MSKSLLAGTILLLVYLNYERSFSESLTNSKHLKDENIYYVAKETATYLEASNLCQKKNKSLAKIGNYKITQNFRSAILQNPEISSLHCYYIDSILSNPTKKIKSNKNLTHFAKMTSNFSDPKTKKCHCLQIMKKDVLSFGKEDCEQKRFYICEKNDEKHLDLIHPRTSNHLNLPALRTILRRAMITNGKNFPKFSRKEVETISSKNYLPFHVIRTNKIPVANNKSVHDMNLIKRLTNSNSNSKETINNDFAEYVNLAADRSNRIKKLITFKRRASMNKTDNEEVNQTTSNSESVGITFSNPTRKTKYITYNPLQFSDSTGFAAIFVVVGCVLLVTGFFYRVCFEVFPEGNDKNFNQIQIKI